MKKRKSYTAEFKAKVALEALREQSTLAQLAAKHGLHANQITLWKKEALEGMASVFERQRGPKAQVPEHDPNLLFQEIGRLQTELNFLKKTLNR